MFTINFELEMMVSQGWASLSSGKEVQIEGNEQMENEDQREEEQIHAVVSQEGGLFLGGYSEETNDILGIIQSEFTFSSIS